MQELSHSSVLTSYHLKTVFLWQCEKIPASEWSTETGLAANLLWLLDELVICVTTHCLPHYFVPENNLLDHIHPDFLADVARTLCRVRHDPLRHVLAFNKHFRFRFSVVSCDLADIFGDIIDDAGQIYHKPQPRLVKQIQALDELGKQHMREKRYDEARCVFTQQIQTMHRLADIYMTPCFRMTFACLELDAAQALGVLEYLITTFPDDLDMWRLLKSLACMYHAVAFAAGNEEKRQELLEKADENLLKAMACSGVNVDASQIDYSMFLLHLHFYEEAALILKQIISRACHNLEVVNGFHDSERDTIEDDNLINEINRHGKFTTFSVAFAYYLLAKLYCDTDRQRDAETLLPGFCLLCNDVLVEAAAVPTLQARAYSLLGYTYVAVKDYGKAGQAFGRAAQLLDDYPLAQENCASCEVAGDR